VDAKPIVAIPIMHVIALCKVIVFAVKIVNAKQMYAKKQSVDYVRKLFTLSFL
jgi:hypothetical protein